MALYSIFKDLDNYAFIGFDREELREKFGPNPKNHIDCSRKVKPYKESWQPVSVHFSDCDGQYKNTIPDIYEFQARLFLSTAAYRLIKPLIENDGEFLPVTYERGDGFIFNPLRIAEDVEGLNTRLSTKDVYDQIESMVFDEDRVKNFSIFKSNFDMHGSMICQAYVKDAIEKAGFGGVIFTPDLGNPFTTSLSQITQTN